VVFDCYTLDHKLSIVGRLVPHMMGQLGTDRTNLPTSHIWVTVRYWILGGGLYAYMPIQKV